MEERNFYTVAKRQLRFFRKKFLRSVRRWFFPGLHIYRAVFPFVLAFFLLTLAGLFWTITTREVDSANASGAKTFLLHPTDTGRVEIISEWGDARENGKRKHQGIDLKAPLGTPVLAPKESWVVKIDRGAKAGNYLWLVDHDGEYVYQFMHLKSVASELYVGKHLFAGERIGGVGQTGNASTPHLHFAIARLEEKYNFKKKLRYLDPMQLFPRKLSELTEPGV